MKEIGKEFCEYFKSKNITKVFTIESSGIAPALMTSLDLNVPLVILKKQSSKILNDNFYKTEVKSFTKNSIYNLTLSKKYINSKDNILIVDDFLANGEAASGAIRLIKLGNANVAGIGIENLAMTYVPSRVTRKYFRH
jgi:xanthine phosphoribosyltransferase